MELEIAALALPAHLAAGNPAMAALAAVPIRKMCIERIDALFPKIQGYWPGRLTPG
jgi:hypothetical protein